MLGLLVQNQSHRAGTHLRGKLLRRIVHQTFFSGEMVSANPGAVQFAATRLRMELDRVPLWRGDHVAIKQLIEDFGRYLYLPRLKEPAVLLEAIREGLRLLTW